MQLLEDFRTIRRTGTPICAIQTSDIPETIRQLLPAITSKPKPPDAPADQRTEWYPVLVWDIVRGLQVIGNERDQQQAGQEAIPGDLDPSTFTGPAGLLAVLDEFRDQRMPFGAVLFLMNAHAMIDDIAVKQAIMNCRDAGKSQRRTLVLLGPLFVLPPELQDVVLLDEPLPTRELLENIATRIYRAAKIDEAVRDDELPQVVDALVGLPAFPAEQAIAMSLTRDGMDFESLWARKRQTIEQTRGLSVWEGGETFEDIGGLANLKRYLTSILNGRASPKAVVWIDEIEKMLAGTAGDNTGISQDYLGQLLSFMQNKSATGMILVGPPGASKSLIAKATGAEGGIPTIQLDMGGMKGSLVGQSEQALRTALKTIEAISDGEMLFIATCNSLAILPPELRRRFTFGTFYCDLPDADERELIWEIYRGKYEVDKDQRIPNSVDWTGAEIKQACELAWRLDISLEVAADYIVPVAVSAFDQVNALRSQAAGKFISASYSGPYRMPASESITAGDREVTTL